MWKYLLHSVLLLFLLTKTEAQDLNITFENLKLTSWTSSSLEEWHVDTLYPISGIGSLHHNYDNDEAGTAFIQYPHDQLLLDSLDSEWSFQVKYEYNPSSSNNWAVQLKNNSFEDFGPDKEGNAYVIGVNYIGSNDYLTLWKQQGNSIETIVKTSFNWEEEIEKGQVVGINIHRSRLGVWKIYIDTSNSNEWIFTGEGIDTSFYKCSGFGIYYKYTSSNDRMLWLDNIHISGCFVKDILSPEIDTFHFKSPKQLLLVFNEPVDTVQPFYCRLNRKDGLMNYNWQSHTELLLEFKEELGLNNLLEIYSIQDYDGNIAQILELVVEYYLPVQHDIVFSEIFADPFPSAGLHEVEFIELYNRSQHTINLEDWKIVIDENETKLSSYSIESNKYLVLIDNDNVSLFDNSIALLGVKNFPSLSNSGASLILKSNQGKNIHCIKYDERFYQSKAKKEGGWSLEIVDINNPCLIESNWKESESFIGGTPGRESSLSGFVLDEISPWTECISVTSNDKLKIVFSEPMDSFSLATKQNYTFPEIGEGYSMKVSDYYNTQIEFSFNEELTEASVYSFIVGEDIKDCSGNKIGESQLRFGMPQRADSGDIIINEVLFEGTEEIPEFIELYNPSDKIVDLRNYRLAFFDGLSSIPSDEFIVSTEFLQLMPDAYIALTENKRQLRHYFSLGPEHRTYELSNWKNLSNSGFGLALVSPDNIILDQANFNSSIHSPLVTNTAGVSLERINPEQKGSIESNWHSASSVSGYASPSEMNSQNLSSANSDNLFAISPKAISPDNDGFEDFVEIRYNLPKPGYFLSVQIFNTNGELISTIAKNELAGTDDVLLWDATSNSGSRVPMGYYIIYFEALHPEGGKLQKKQTVVVLP